MSKIPVALQLYSVRDECERDFVATIKTVAEMGYEGVEFAGCYGLSAERLAALLSDLNLEVAGSHISMGSLAPENFDQTVEFNRELGNRNLVVAFVEAEKSRSFWANHARRLNEISDKLRLYDMLTGYHNHAQEFQPVNDEMPWDIVFSNTNEDIIMQVDTGNALMAGEDVVPYIEKYPGRARTVHLKEYSPKDPNALLGAGDVDWPRVFETCQEFGGTQWYIVEQETWATSSLEAARKNLEALREMGL